MATWEQLTQTSFGSDLWNITNELALVKNSVFSDISNSALLVGFLVMTFQIFIIMWQSNKDDPNAASNIPRRLIALFIQVGFVAALLKTPAYLFFYKFVIGMPAELIAQGITLSYIADYQKQFADVFGEISKSNSLTWGIITATFNGSLINTIIASVIFTLCAICSYIYPIILGKFYLYFFYFGPFALVFTFCDYTQSVAKAWLNLSLAIAWTTVFASLALLLIVGTGIIVNLNAGIQGDWIQTSVYGLAAIILMNMAFPISSFVFSAGGIGMLNPAGAVAKSAGVGAAGTVAGAAAASVGGGLMSRAGSALSKAAGGASRGGGNRDGSGGSVSGGSPSNVPLNSSGGGGGTSSISSTSNSVSANSGGSSNSSFTSSSVSKATVPSSSLSNTIKSALLKTGAAMTIAGNVMSKAGQVTLDANTINSNMPKDATKKVNELIGNKSEDKEKEEKQNV